MLTLRKSGERGTTTISWLESKHTFSFGTYQDSEHEGFKRLKVLNEDWIAPNTGFDLHEHQNMEIITYMIDGTLEHLDSLGNQATLRKKDVQHISAGTGILHQEYAGDKGAHLLQIWILPEQNTKPRHAQQELLHRPGWEPFSVEILKNTQCCISTGIIKSRMTEKYAIPKGKCAWLQVVFGKLMINGLTVSSGDGIATDESLHLVAAQDSEVLVIEMRNT